RFRLPRVEEVQEQRLHEIVPVMAEGDLRRGETLRRRVEDPAAKARAERAVRLALGDLFRDDRVRVLLHDEVLETLAGEVLGEELLRKSGMPLVHVHGD